ncbi:MAG: hypothetical protein F6K39_45265 [Okeania sp. SIO3B3]|nr:hypothetical protein [Okeania sp. SIO3B3]
MTQHPAIAYSGQKIVRRTGRNSNRRQAERKEKEKEDKGQKGKRVKG